MILIVDLSDNFFELEDKMQSQYDVKPFVWHKNSMNNVSSVETSRVFFFT